MVHYLRLCKHGAGEPPCDFPIGTTKCLEMRPEHPYITPGTINLEPENGPLEDYFPLQPSGFQVPC